MVFEAVEALNDRRGVSLHSIKKYLRDNKKVDAEAKALSIKKHLKAFVEEGKLVQVAGTGANGTFKIPGKKTTSQKASTCSKVITKVASRPKIGKILSGQKEQSFRNLTNMHQRVSKKALKGKMDDTIFKHSSVMNKKLVIILREFTAVLSNATSLDAFPLPPAATSRKSPSHVLVYLDPQA
ncbi:histone H1.1, embryonic-like [Penaeus chinensis]|uniref:histone H1.1, embryonic-like n=1 Tax=Penaeus chinensis TaxID=139456 RepID=UPI001FB61F2E|nr:histone H1.1, embryonic-like [Penaeus chinensis]